MAFTLSRSEKIRAQRKENGERNSWLFPSSLRKHPGAKISVTLLSCLRPGEPADFPACRFVSTLEI
jgi:hypothetical protein